MCWSVLQAMGFAILLTFPVIALPVAARLVAGLLLLAVHQLLLKHYWLPLALDSTHGGPPDALGWTAMLILASVFADLAATPDRRKLYASSIAVACASGLALNLWVPVSKARVSASYVLVSLGVSAALYGLFCILTGRLHWRSAYLIAWGRNSLVLYLLLNLLLALLVLPDIPAWHALRMQLRGQMDVNELAPYLDAAELAALRQAPSKASPLLLAQGRRIYDAMASGILQGFDSFQLEGQLAALASQQAICERIKMIPVPRQYDYFTRLFVWTFILLTPLSLVGTLVRENIGFLLVPLTLLFAFVFAIVQRTGEVNEEPFENRITDVPLSAICRLIERDVREILGERDLPPKLEPKDGYLW